MRKLLLAAAMELALCASAQAQDWPARPVTMGVPFAAGGPIDTVARILAARLGDILGQQVIVENVGGAGGMTGSARVAKAAPDGYQVLLGNIGTHAYSQTLNRKPLYDAIADFAPVGLVAENFWVLILRKGLPAATLPEFIAYARANQDRMQFGSGGAGSATHIACVLLNMAMGVTITHVPYRGAGPAMQDLVGDRLDYMCDVISTALPQIQSNTVRVIANLGPARTPVLPDLATAQEQGLAGFGHFGWNAFFVPKGTPEVIVRRLNAAAGKALDTPAIRARMEGLGLRVPPPETRSPDYLAQFVASEITKWAEPIRRSGVGEN